jgi:hypothetical protein
MKRPFVTDTYTLETKLHREDLVEWTEGLPQEHKDVQIEQRVDTREGETQGAPEVADMLRSAGFAETVTSTPPGRPDA